MRRHLCAMTSCTIRMRNGPHQRLLATKTMKYTPIVMSIIASGNGLRLCALTCNGNDCCHMCPDDCDAAARGCFDMNVIDEGSIERRISRYSYCSPQC